MLEIHIGRKTRAPDKCPQCAAAPIPWDGTTYGLFKSFYGSAAQIVRRPVPGWKGYHTWYFTCVHEHPFNAVIYETNPLFALVPKDVCFNGGSFHLPLRSLK